MLIKSIENIGEKTINFVISFYEMVVFFTTTLFKIFNLNNYTNKLQKNLIIKIYRSSILTIPLFSVLAFVFGSIVVATAIIYAANYNFHMQIGSLLITFIINEFSVLFTSLFVFLKLDTYSNRSTKFTDDFIITNTISSIISILSLSILFSIIMIISAYILIFLLIGMDLNSYKSLVFSGIGLDSFVILFFKAISFGLIVSIIPLYMKIKRNKSKTKNTKFATMTTILISIFFIEILSLLLQSL